MSYRKAGLRSVASAMPEAVFVTSGAGRAAMSTARPQACVALTDRQARQRYDRIREDDGRGRVRAGE